MSENQVKIRRKELPKKNSGRIYIFVSLAIIVLLGIAVTVAITVFSDKPFFEKDLEIVSEGNRQIIKVPAGGNLQTAINRANSGDIIELQAGASYNEISLPNKSLTEFITIRSSAISKLPENQRVKPEQSNLLAKIITRGEGKPAVSTENGAHHYRFVGIEFVPKTADYIYNLVLFGADQTKLSDVPHDFEIDRCYFRPNKTGIVRRGLALNSANTVIKHSYFEGFAFSGEETQAICGWTGTKNVKIINNHLEGGAENVMFGGSDPANAELIPQDIEIRGNYFFKPESWKGKVSLKCLFELKNAKRVQLIGNILENNWVGAAFRITVRNQDGKATFSTVEDVVIKDNVINGAGDGINILGKDDTHPSQTMKNLQIVNNLMLNIGDPKFEGSGYFLQVSDGENILIANNTSINTGNIASFHGTSPKNFTARDNIIGHGNYGVHGLNDLKSIAAQRLFQNNLIVNNKNIPKSDFAFPPNNFLVSTLQEIGFANVAQNDLRLAVISKFKGKGKDKTDIGSNLMINNSIKK